MYLRYSMVCAIAFISICILTFAFASPNIIRLKNGEVQGTTMRSFKGREFFAFLGIPFAEPPLGDLRFKPPVPKRPWKEKGVLDGTKNGPICTQRNIVTGEPIGQEDCLILNVYTPEIPATNKKLPVMVWIHGGGFFFGYSWLYGPDHILDHEVILVTFNYRLDALGFLSTHDSASPGNYGLLDQTEALRWVKENIHAFGGDPNKITIFGESAGAVSVTFHLMSPLSKGLFHQAIAMSGSLLCEWSFSKNNLPRTKEIAMKFNCPTDDHNDLVNCLRAVPAHEIVQLTGHFMEEILIPHLPVVDNNFFTSDPQESLGKGKIHNKVPLITGIVKDEGIGIYYLIHRDIVPYSDKVWNYYVRTSAGTGGDIPEVIELLKKYYLKDCDVNNEMEYAKAACKMISDGGFNIAHYQTAQYMAKAGVKTYSYMYDYANNHSLLAAMLGVKKKLKGVAHSDELPIFFGGEMTDLVPLNDRSIQIMEKSLALWTNFAKYGDPTATMERKWPESKFDNIYEYHINDPEEISLYKPSEDSAYNLWVKKVPIIVKNHEKHMRDEL